MQGIRQELGATTRRALVSGLSALALSAPFAAGRTPSRVAPLSPGTSQDGASAADQLRDLLSLVPAAALLGERATDKLFDWVDYRSHFEMLGVDDPYARSRHIPDQVRSLQTSDPLLEHVLDPSIARRAGFRTLDVHQVLVAGVLPEHLTYYRGGFSSAEVIAHLELVGYEKKSRDHGDFWTIGEDGSIDFRDELHLAVGNHMHNVAVLDDETMVYAAKADHLEPVLALAAGEVPSAADDSSIAALLDVLPADAVTVLAMPGVAFIADLMIPVAFDADGVPGLDELLRQSDEVVGQMPPILMSISGATAGALDPGAEETAGTANPDAFAFMTVLTESEEAARQVADVAFWRLENMISPLTGDAYSERFAPINSPDEAVDGETVSLRFDGDVVNNALWASLISSNDVWPFAWAI